MRAINNLAYNEHTNAYFKCNNILKLSDQYKLHISNYFFQILHSNIDDEIGPSLLLNNQIHCNRTRTNNQMSILGVIKYKTKYCILQNGMITWNSLPDVIKVNVPFSMFKSKVRNWSDIGSSWARLCSQFIWIWSIFQVYTTCACRHS